jgi:hypothetical protein
VNVACTVALDALIPATAVGASGSEGRTGLRPTTDPAGPGSKCGRGHEVKLSVSALAAIRSVS